MAGKFQDAGLTRKLNDIRSAWNATLKKLHLYKNNFTPTESSILSDFTEADFPGYVAQDIPAWGAAAIAAHVASITADPVTFTRSTTGAVQEIYGYYVTDSGATALYFSERDPAAPRTVTNAGDSITVACKITDQNV